MAVLQAESVANLNKDAGGLLALELHQCFCGVVLEVHILHLGVEAVGDQVAILIEVVLDCPLHRAFRMRPPLPARSTEQHGQQANHKLAH